MVALSVVEPRLKGLIGIELDKVRASQAQRNITLNQLQDSMVVRADIRALPIPAAFDLVVANPPFYPLGWGRQSTDENQLSATHELNGNLMDFIGAARTAMREDGHLVLVYDSSRVETLLRTLPSYGLLAKKMRFLEDDRGKASRVLVMAGRGGAGLAVDIHRSMNLG
jgi:tRNA1(Val) A37 N6-methylase TrmN6